MRTVDPQKNLAQRSKILDRARRLFADRGFTETSMSEIGKACQMTKPALYHYFKNKEAILSGLFQETWAQTEELIAKMPKPRNLEELLLVTGRVYIGHWEDAKNLELCKITLRENAHSAEVKRESLTLVKPRMEKHILAVFAPFLPRGMKPEEIKLFAFQYFGALFHYMFVDKILDEGKQLPSGKEKYLKSLAHLFAAGIQSRRLA